MSSASPIALAVAALLGLFTVLAFVDGVLIHLFKERLHTRAESRTEHWLHTARAFAFIPALLTVFSDAKDAWLAIGIGVLVIDELLAIADGIVERRSRRSSGGLPTLEYLIHVGVTGVHWAAIALALVLRFEGRDGAFMKSLSHMMLPGAVAIALIHVAVALKKPRAIVLTPMERAS